MSIPPSTTTGLGHHADSLLPQVYDELRAIAGRRLRGERAEHTLQSTALVHEAFIRLHQQDKAKWKNASEFKAIAAHVMYQILIDHARKRNALKNGGGKLRLTLDEMQIPDPTEDVDLLALDRALTDLKKLDDRQYQVVVLRYFGGLKVADIAAVLGVGKRTVDSDWAFVRTWLHRRLEKDD